MPRNDSASGPVADHLHAHVMACDALVNAKSDAIAGKEQPISNRCDVDANARSRMLLLLRMLDAADMPVAAKQPTRCADDVSKPAPSGLSQFLLERFEVIEDLGSGGFGFVVRARDLVLGREVALKMPLPERVLRPGGVYRFLREAQAAARLDHRNIVRVFDAGAIGPLGYYIASEFCPGPSLAQWLRQQFEPVKFQQAAEWMAMLADAVAHAHERGILHRDIKPGNIILVSVSDSDEWVPRLTDFGLAKLVEETGDETRSDIRIGTPQYMAPEQAAGRHVDVGTATDIHALGVTLYEVLTGRSPFRGDSEQQTLNFVIESDPIPLRTLRPGLPRDLETICLKCLRKEPARRYGSAGELRDDLRRFLEGRAILGRPVSRRERVSIWVRRRPAIAGLLALVVLLLGSLAGGVFAWASSLNWHNQQLRVHVARANEHARIAEEQQRLANRHHHAENLRLARRALDDHERELAQDILHDVISPSEADSDGNDFASRYLWREAHREFSQLWGHQATVRALAFSPDGRLLATRDLRGKILVWHLDRKMALDRPVIIDAFSATDQFTVTFSPDSRRLAAYENTGKPSFIHVFESVSGQEVTRLDCGEVSWFHAIHFDATGSRLATEVIRPDESQFLLSWNLLDNTRNRGVRPIDSHSVIGGNSAGFSVILENRDGRSRLLDPWAQQGTTELEAVGLTMQPHVDISADGRVIAAETLANDIRLWDTVTGHQLAVCDSMPGICQIALSPFATRLAMLNDQGGLVVFDRLTKRTKGLTLGTGRKVNYHSLSFSSDERLLSVGQHTSPGSIQPPEVWDIAKGEVVASFPGKNLSQYTAFVPNSRSLIVLGDTRPRIWRLDSPEAPEKLDGHVAEAWSAAFAPDGIMVATSSDDTNEKQTIKLWDQRTGQLLAGWAAHTATVASVAFSRDGKILASGSLDSGARGHANLILWDVASRRMIAKLTGHTGAVRCLAFSPDGQTLASASDDLTVRIWDVASKRTRHVLSAHTSVVKSVAFSPDGRLLGSGSCDSTVRLWDVAAGRLTATLADHSNVFSVAFSATGSFLASVNEAGEIKVWDPARAQIIRTIHVNSEPLLCVRFTPDEHSVVAAGKGQTIHFWDTLTGQELLTLKGHQSQINALDFSADGSLLASCDHQGKVKIWRAEWPGLALAP